MPSGRKKLLVGCLLEVELGHQESVRPFTSPRQNILHSIHPKLIPIIYVSTVHIGLGNWVTFVITCGRILANDPSLVASAHIKLVFAAIFKDIFIRCTSKVAIHSWMIARISQGSWIRLSLIAALLANWILTWPVYLWTCCRCHQWILKVILQILLPHGSLLALHWKRQATKCTNAGFALTSHLWQPMSGSTNGGTRARNHSPAGFASIEPHRGAVSRLICLESMECVSTNCSLLWFPFWSPIRFLPHCSRLDQPLLFVCRASYPKMKPFFFVLGFQIIILLGMSKRFVRATLVLWF